MHPVFFFGFVLLFKGKNKKRMVESNNTMGWNVERIKQNEMENALLHRFSTFLFVWRMDRKMNFPTRKAVFSSSWRCFERRVCVIVRFVMARRMTITQTHKSVCSRHRNCLVSNWPPPGLLYLFTLVFKFCLLIDVGNPLWWSMRVSCSCWDD